MRRDLDSSTTARGSSSRFSAALASRTPLRIRGGDSKAFLGRAGATATSSTRARHRGIVSYDPTELVDHRARRHAARRDSNALLDDAGQMLPCEPPRFGGDATVGGAVASGLSGPRRPWAGSVRDFVLGCRVITGAGEASALRRRGDEERGGLRHVAADRGQFRLPGRDARKCR